MNQLFQFIQKFDAPLEAYISTHDQEEPVLTLRYRDKKPEINALFDKTLSEFAPKLQQELKGQACELEIEPCPNNDSFEITIRIAASEEDCFTIYQVPLSTLAITELTKYNKPTIALAFRTENIYQLDEIEFSLKFSDSQESDVDFVDTDPAVALFLASQLNPGILDKKKRVDKK